MTLILPPTRLAGPTGKARDGNSTATGGRHNGDGTAYEVVCRAVGTAPGADYQRGASCGVAVGAVGRESALGRELGDWRVKAK